MNAARQDVFQRPGGPRLNLVDSGGDGAPVIFQHGLCGDAAQPAEVFPQDAGFRCLTLESRGHGSSEAGDPDAFSIASFAADLMAMIEMRRLAPSVIGGISMGAAISLHIAVHHPGLLRGLILARPAWSTQAAPENMRPNAEVGDLLRRLPADAARLAFEASDTAHRLASEAPDNLASLRGFFTRQPQDTTASLLCAIAADGPGVTAAQLRAITVPVLVIGHERDAVHPMAMAEELAALIPGSRLARITPKAVDKDRYVGDFRLAMTKFLKELD